MVTVAVSTLKKSDSDRNETWVERWFQCSAHLASLDDVKDTGLVLVVKTTSTVEWRGEGVTAELAAGVSGDLRRGVVRE